MDTGTVFVIMSIAHAQSIFMPINVRALCTVIILSCHMLDPAVSSLVNGLVYVTLRGNTQSHVDKSSIKLVQFLQLLFQPSVHWSKQLLLQSW